MFSRILFVSMNHTCRGPMAEHIMRQITSHRDITITSRGLVVLFPEPYNPKAVAVLRQRGIILENGSSREFAKEDVTKDTLVLALGIKEKEMLMESYDIANLQTVCEFAGVSEQLTDPYGKEIDSYVEFGDSLAQCLRLVDSKLNEITDSIIGG